MSAAWDGADSRNMGWGESMTWESQKRQNCSMINHAWDLMRFWSLDSETAPNIETLMKFGGVPLTLEMNVGIGADHSGRTWNAEWCRFTGVGKKLASYQLLCSNDSAEFILSDKWMFLFWEVVDPKRHTNFCCDVVVVVIVVAHLWPLMVTSYHNLPRPSGWKSHQLHSHRPIYNST